MTLRSPHTVLAFMLLSTPVLAQDATAGATEPPIIERRIDVSGSGQVELVPDQAELIFGVSLVDKNAQKAMKDATTRVNAIMSALEEAGIDEKDMKTTELSITPRENYESGKRMGYQVDSGLTVIIRDLDILPALLDSLSEAGMNELRNLSFSSSQNKAAQNEALELAVQDAKARADLMAAAAGVSVGAPVNMSSNVSAVPLERPELMLARAADAAGAEMKIAEGSMQVQADVSITYELIAK